MREIHRVTILGTLADLKLVRVGEDFPVLKGTIAADAPTGESPNTFYLPFHLRDPYAEIIIALLIYGDVVHASSHLESHAWQKGDQPHTNTTLMLDTPQRPKREPDGRGLAHLVSGLNSAPQRQLSARPRPQTPGLRGHPLHAGAQRAATANASTAITSAAAARELRKGDSALVIGPSSALAGRTPAAPRYASPATFKQHEKRRPRQRVSSSCRSKWFSLRYWTHLVAHLKLNRHPIFVGELHREVAAQLVAAGGVVGVDGE